MKLVNEAQFLTSNNITLFLPPDASAATFIVPLTNIYTSLYSHKIDLNIKVLN